MHKLKKIHLEIFSLTSYNNPEINEILSDFTCDSDLLLTLTQLLDIKDYKNEEVCGLTEIVTDYLLENKLTKTDDCVLDENNLFNILTNKILEMKFTKPTKSISSMLLSYMHCLSKLFPYTLHKQKIFAKFLAALSDKSIYYLHKSITIPFLNVFYYFEEIIIKKEIYKQINLKYLINYFNFQPELFFYLIDSDLINNLLFKYQEKYFIYWLLKNNNLSIFKIMNKVNVLPLIYYWFDKNELFCENESEKWFTKFFDKKFVNDLTEYLLTKDTKDKSMISLNSEFSLCKYCVYKESEYFNQLILDLKNKKMKKLTKFSAKFLRFSHKTDLISLGNFICKEKNVDQLKIFLSTFYFSNQLPLKALKIFLESFILPGESQIIYRVIEYFTEKYCSDQSDLNYLFEDPSLEMNQDNVFVYFYALIQLNTTLHNPYATMKHTLQSFQNTLKNQNIKKEIVVNDFYEIKENPFVYQKNNTFSFVNYELYKEISEVKENKELFNEILNKSIDIPVNQTELTNQNTTVNILNNQSEICYECTVKCYKNLIRKVSFYNEEYLLLCKALNENSVLLKALKEIGDKILENKSDIKEIKVFLEYYFYVLNCTEVTEDFIMILKLPFYLFNYILSNKIIYILNNKKESYEAIYIDFIKNTQNLSNEVFYFLTSLEIQNDFDKEMMFDILKKNIWRINQSKILINEEILITQCVEYNLKDQFYFLIKNKLDPLFLIDCYHKNKEIFETKLLLPLLDESVNSFKLLLLVSNKQIFNNVVEIKEIKTKYNKVKSVEQNVEYERKDVFSSYVYVERFKEILSIGKNVIRMMISSECIGNVKIILENKIDLSNYDLNNTNPNPNPADLCNKKLSNTNPIDLNNTNPIDLKNINHADLNNTNHTDLSNKKLSNINITDLSNTNLIDNKNISNTNITDNNLFDSLIYLILKYDDLEDLDLKKYLFYLLKLLTDKHYNLYLTFLNKCIGILFNLKNKELLNYLVELFKYKSEKESNFKVVEQIKTVIKDYELVEDDWNDVYEI